MSLQVFLSNDTFLRAALSEAILISWRFTNQQVTVHLESDEGSDITLYASTDIVFGRKVSGIRALDICRLEIIDLAEKLVIKNGYYTPSESLKDIFKNKDFSFAYGRPVDVKYCITFTGSERLLIFPINTLSDILYEVN